MTESIAPQVAKKVRCAMNALTQAPDALIVAQAEETSMALAPGVTKTLSGYVEETTMADFDFRNQQRTFEMLGYAHNPSVYANGSQDYVGNRFAAQQAGGATMAELRGENATRRAESRAMKKRRKGTTGDASIVDGPGAYVGPWGGWEGEQGEPVPQEAVGPTADELQAVEESAEKRKLDLGKLTRRRELDEVRGTEKSIFHGASMHDYQGRTFMHIPTDADVNLRGEPGALQSYIPSTCVRTWTGHTKGISALRLFPNSGHMVLSGSMDTKIKLWDVYREGGVLRTYLGHAKPISDVSFSPDGRQFLSAGFDHWIKLWDTESGVCLKSYLLDSVANCICFHPQKPHIFLAGTSDKKILQYDTTTDQVTQEYNQHQGPVNTITFVDEDKRFVSTSDDKTMRVWDFDIPVVVKLVADPSMQSMPSVALHPDQKWLACQSMDNQMLVYNADNFKQSKRRTFRGHQVQGFACEIGFSPDGRFVSSGDRQGNLVFWDWKSGGLLKRLPCHKDVLIAHDWLPHETSKVVTGGWDGLIRLWT
ncbi:hypothetical protein MVES_000488 [Malassezia vespertilionis]|uniref:Pre-mRNA-processing factor 17 n=2 Tax=Malassezia vespertilionis TaxID=2020962 RepID=A0A2N1JG99_9BASI|nr:hypothetical protein MVES_000488 [Malassezia vespertilionis]